MKVCDINFRKNIPYLQNYYIIYALFMLYFRSIMLKRSKKHFCTYLFSLRGQDCI